MKNEAIVLSFIDDKARNEALRKPFRLDGMSCFSDMSKFIFFEGECLWADNKLSDCPDILKQGVASIIGQIKSSKYTDIKYWQDVDVVNGVKMAKSNILLLKEMGVKQVWNHDGGTLFFKKGVFMGCIKGVMRLTKKSN